MNFISTLLFCCILYLLALLGDNRIIARIKCVFQLLCVSLDEGKIPDHFDIGDVPADFIRTGTNCLLKRKEN